MADSPLGPLLRRYRTGADLTLEQLSEASGVSDRAISDIERGASRRPQHRTVVALADALALHDADRAELLRVARAARSPDAAADVLPLPRAVPDFTGRDTELAAASKALVADPGTPSPVVLITGPPGFGKTTLAIQVAAALRPRFDEVLFLDLRGLDAQPVPPEQLVDTLLSAFAPGSPVPPEQAVTRLRELLAARNVLLVLDNAASEAQVRAVLPPSAPAAVLVTSRRSLGGLDGVQRVELAPLGADAAAQLLARIVPAGQATATDLARLARLCDDVPLALRIAGNRLASRAGWTVSGLASRLAADERRLDTLVAGDLRIKNAFRVSYDLLGPDAQRLFRRLSLVDGPTVGAPLAAVLADDGLWRTEELLDELADLSLVQHATDDRYQLHDLLRLYARHELEAEEGTAAHDSRERSDAWLLTTTAAAGRWFEPIAVPGDADPVVGFADAPTAKGWLMAEAGNWLAAYTRAAGRDDHRQVVDVADALHWFSDLWTVWGHWDRVFALSARSAQALGDDRLAAVHLGYLAWAQFECVGDDAGAARSADAAYAAAVRTGDDALIGWAALYVAIVQVRRRDLAAASEGATRAVEHLRRAGERQGLPQALMLVADLENAQDRPDAALSTLSEVIAMVTESTTRPGGALVADFTLANAHIYVAKVQSRLGRWEEVLAAVQRADAFSDALGSRRMRASIYYYRGLAHARLGEREAAERDLLASLDLRRQLPDNGSTEPIQTVLAELQGA